jgi:hypothetical protein
MDKMGYGGFHNCQSENFTKWDTLTEILSSLKLLKRDTA